MPDEKKSDKPHLRAASRCVHAPEIESAGQPLSTPLYQTSSFRFENADRGEAMIARGEPGFAYTRLGNPTTLALEQQMALLEGGADAVAFASGMAAVSSVVLALAENGTNIVTSHSLYGGTHKFFADQLPRLGIEVRTAKTRSPEDIDVLVDKKTRLVYIETPINPTLELVDIEACCAVANRHGVPAVVDNTFATPVFQNPLALGASAVVHSATKYLGGHSDLLAGVAVVKEQSLGTTLRRSILRDFGAVLDPFAAWLVLRGIMTLAVRMEKHERNASALADWLSKHGKVSRVNYPGHPSHPQHALAKKQMRGFGGMLSFEVKGGDREARAVLDACRLCAITATLGGCESIITHPASTTHSPYPRELREKLGVTDSLIRLSVGIEDVEDLKEDLERGLAKV